MDARPRIEFLCPACGTKIAESLERLATGQKIVTCPNCRVQVHLPSAADRVDRTEELRERKRRLEGLLGCSLESLTADAGRNDDVDG